MTHSRKDEQITNGCRSFFSPRGEPRRKAVAFSAFWWGHVKSKSIDSLTMPFEVNASVFAVSALKLHPITPVQLSRPASARGILLSGATKTDGLRTGSSIV